MCWSSFLSDFLVDNGFSLFYHVTNGPQTQQLKTRVVYTAHDTMGWLGLGISQLDLTGQLGFGLRTWNVTTPLCGTGDWLALAGAALLRVSLILLGLDNLTGMKTQEMCLLVSAPHSWNRDFKTLIVSWAIKVLQKSFYSNIWSWLWLPNTELLNPLIFLGWAGHLLLWWGNCG